MIGIPSIPGFRPNYYVCYDHNIIETINYMLDSQKDDFPNTACVGFTLIREEGLIKIYPKVANPKYIIDFLTGEKTEWRL